MKYEKVREQERQFKAVTSLSVVEFDKLLLLFRPKLEKYLKQYTLNGKQRTRKYSPRTDFDMSAENLLFFILVYHKNNTLQEMHAAMFGLTQDMCNKLIHILYPLLHKSLEEYRPAEVENIRKRGNI